MPWEDVSYTVEAVESPQVNGFLDTLGQLYVNGDIVFRVLRAREEAAFDDALRNDFRGMDYPVRTFLSHPSVVAAVPELCIPSPLERAPEFDSCSLFAMEGQLTHMLLGGGAYGRFRGTIAEARTLSRSFMEALFGENLHEGGWAACSSTPWTPWFCDVAWDSTFVVLDYRAKRFILLCATDTD